MTESDQLAGNIAARKTAEECIDLFLAEGQQIEATHGLPAAERFFDILRDAVNGIRPAPQKPPETTKVPPTDRREAYDSDADRGDMVCVTLTGTCIADTEKAFGVQTESGETVWLPKSQVGEEAMSVGDELETVWMPKWLAEKKELV